MVHILHHFSPSIHLLFLVSSILALITKRGLGGLHDVPQLTPIGCRMVTEKVAHRFPLYIDSLLFKLFKFVPIVNESQEPPDEKEGQTDKDDPENDPQNDPQDLRSPWAF